MRAVLVLGPDEVAQGKATLKDLANGTQVVLNREAVASALKQILERP